ncbi:MULTISPECIES: EspA/EspE family type VII secretion system effector [unclassified Mycobacterium]|uniref:EspA/EspE family type VII secretion system effector n=2 Tax=Mycobacterium TaxID=1763 RepID=UPI000B20FF7D|nr:MULTISPECIES: EspA/EspE family type VII secretion system effector [unclassified Mycobacterium]
MSIVADALRMLTNLGNFGSQFIGLDAKLTPPTSDTDGGSEYLAASVTGMTGGLGSSFTSRQILGGVYKATDFVTQYDRNKGVRTNFSDARWAKHTKYLYNPNDRVQTALRGKPGFNVANPMQGRTGAAVNILPWTASVVGYLELLTGFGPPNEGNDLKAGAELWGALHEQLKSAIPREGWEGEASDAYAAQVALLRDIAQTMAGLDGQLAEIVANQAEWVTHFRLGFGILLNLLTAAIAIEVVLRIALAYVPGGPAWAVGWAIAASSLAMAAALGMLGALTGISVENRNKADHLTSEIERLGAAAAQIAVESTAQSVVTAAPESRVSEFQSLDGPSATLAAPGGGQSVRPKVTGQESERTQTGTLESSPDAKRDDTQSAGMPTLAALMQLSNREGNNPAQSPGRQRRQANSTTEATPADTGQTQGAGSDATDRAPVEAAGDTKRTPQPNLGTQLR